MSWADRYGRAVESPRVEWPRCRCCGTPMPEDRVGPRTRWCSRACTVYMANLRRCARNKAAHGVTRPRSRVARHAALWRRRSA